MANEAAPIAVTRPRRASAGQASSTEHVCVQARKLRDCHTAGLREVLRASFQRVYTVSVAVPASLVGLGRWAACPVQAVRCLQLNNGGK